MAKQNLKLQKQPTWPTVEASKSNIVEGQRAMAFSTTNYILLAIGVLVVVIGFILMAGGSSTSEAFNPDIFSPLRIKVAPMVCLGGFLFIIVAILFHKKEKPTSEIEEPAALINKTKYNK